MSLAFSLSQACLPLAVATQNKLFETLQSRTEISLSPAFIFKAAQFGKVTKR
jgi:hypothetical protein